MQLLVRRVRRPILIIGCCLAVGAGLFFARRVALGDARWLWAVMPLVGVSLRWHNAGTLLLLIVVCFGIGWWRGTGYVQKLAVHERLRMQHVKVVGRATDDAVYGKRYQLEFGLDHVQVTVPEHVALVGSLTIRGFGESAIYRGDTIEVQGTLYPTKGNNLASISFANLRVLSRGSSPVDQVRRTFTAGMQSALPEPLASFGLGLLIGQRSTLPDDIANQLRVVGLTHIIAVSGYNLTIIVMACQRLLAKRSKYQTAVSCLALICLFLLVTGSSPPIVRASIISVLSILAWYVGRTIKPLCLLLTAAAVTVLANPLYLWGNVSWYLSFLAFFGVLVVAPYVTQRLYGSRQPGMIGQVVIESACAGLLTIPYILYIFGQISLVSLIANVIVLPMVPLAMLVSTIAGFAGMWVPALAGWFAWPAAILLTGTLDIVTLLSRIPHAFVEHIGVSWLAMTVIYGAVGIVLVALQRRNKMASRQVANRVEM